MQAVQWRGRVRHKVGCRAYLAPGGEQSTRLAAGQRQVGFGDRAQSVVNVQRDRLNQRRTSSPRGPMGLPMVGV